MIAYIKGEFTEISPIRVLVECNGLGYRLNISLHTYQQIQGKKAGMLFTHFHVREDQQTLYGFATEAERKLFRMLISVSGIGTSTAMLVLSAYPPVEIQSAILNNNLSLIKSIKGIGPKTAQRLVLELSDKLRKEPDLGNSFGSQNNSLKAEALSALTILGYSRLEAEKVIQKTMQKQSNILNVEQLIKAALQNM